jgi:CheY-like chemotaxis protein
MSTVDPDAPPAARPLRILLIEDSPEGRRALSRFLTRSGFDVIDRPDGASALEVLRAGPAPDVILTDLLMPDMDGRQVCWHARQLAPAARVALITGWSVELAALDPQRGGFDRVFLKPLDVQALMRFLLDREPDRHASDPGA